MEGLDKQLTMPILLQTFRLANAESDNDIKTSDNDIRTITVARLIRTTMAQEKGGRGFHCCGLFIKIVLKMLSIIFLFKKILFANISI